ncbi:MAG: DUF5683 domain-containing protein [Bacteroidales bacterium]|nr:DUF5683 domain-containing protein [Bacteroidales bacterium]MDD2323627.1 DUF5683 domain-containing protein [Bacteroidales bacterium]MDD3011545.1 DUF5683 domain-containing protein [Bacteroidales bacterium]MDD3960416.1 DUF5683 domain-containing protein [Bacteroidales bacterium]MDY0285550.1 DUF5683 domain-containing protein [Bacteroidales bacterium]
MKYIIMQNKFFCFLTSVCLLVGMASQAQSSSETLHYARSLTKLNRHLEAVDAYRRVLYFHPELTDSIARETGHALRKAGYYDKARYYYNIAFHHTHDTLKKANIRFDIVHSYILEREFMTAHLQLTNMRYALPVYNEKKMAFYRGIVAFQTDQIKEAKNNFVCYFNEQDTSIVLQAMKNAEKNLAMNPQKAMWLSLIVPGLGQIYNKEYIEATNSFIINTFFLSIYFYVALNYNPLQGFIAVLPWFQRYYIGGMKRAKQLTIEKKESEKQRILAALLDEALKAKE